MRVNAGGGGGGGGGSRIDHWIWLDTHLIELFPGKSVFGLEFFLEENREALKMVSSSIAWKGGVVWEEKKIEKKQFFF